MISIILHTLCFYYHFHLNVARHSALNRCSMYHAARGRTNVELREQFILPEGASQAMASFKSKMARDPASIPTIGPITKVRSATVTPYYPFYNLSLLLFFFFYVLYLCVSYLFCLNLLKITQSR